MTSHGNSKLKIAVLDDEKSLLGVFSSLMRQFGYAADFFENPHVAFEKIAANPGDYKLVIADIRMEGMDGITFAEKVRTVLSDIPFIFMTGNLTDDIRRRAEVLGRNMIFEKPFPLISTLKDAIALLTSS